MFLTLFCKFPKKKIIYSKGRWSRSVYFWFLLHNLILRTPTTNSAAKFRAVNILSKFTLLQKTATLSSANQLNLYTFWFFLYQQQYFSHLYKTPILLKNINAISVVPYSILKYMVNSVRNIRWKRYFIMHSNEIIEILLISLWLRNLKLFMDWMRKYFESTNLKKHRKLFLLLNLLLGKFIWNYNLFLSLQGLRVSLVGKFGKAGSVRKTRRYIKRGKCSYTTKKIALVSQTNLIKTLTGVFSIKFEVFY